MKIRALCSISREKIFDSASGLVARLAVLLVMVLLPLAIASPVFAQPTQTQPTQTQPTQTQPTQTQPTQTQPTQTQPTQTQPTLKPQDPTQTEQQTPATEPQLEHEPGTQTETQTEINQPEFQRPDEQQLPPAAPSEFDGAAAFEILKQLCEIGPRISGTDGMRRQQEILTQHFETLGATVFQQKFQVRHPMSGEIVELANLAVRFHPEREKRLLICCHYDTRPFPDQDQFNPQGVFLGANDGASGTALLYELGKHMPALDGDFGIDFVFFDGEEFVYVAQRDEMFLGSTHFAREYAAGRIPAKYTFGVLVDMIGDKDLQIHYEGNSLGFAPRLTRSIWGVAQRLGVTEFTAQERHKIRDDHLPLNQIAGIETCDIIDFDYPNPEVGNQYWHTTNDTVENCSAESLDKVGRVVLEWLRQMQQLNGRNRGR